MTTTQDGIDFIDLPHGTAAIVCEGNPLAGAPNEDGAIVLPIGDARVVLAVADGMGGQPAGDRASTLALAALADCVHGPRGAPPDGALGGLRAAILDGFETANRRIQSTGGGGGTTLAVVEVADRAIRPYHAGDSVILVVGQRGRLRFQSMPHSPVGYAVEAGLLDETDAMHHDERHVVSNFVGSAEMRIDVGPSLRLNPRDTVVLGSDGLFDNLHVEEIVERVRKGPLEAAARRLAETCRQRMTAPRADRPSKADDLTFILYRPPAVPRAGRAGPGGDRR